MGYPSSETHTKIFAEPHTMSVKKLTRIPSASFVRSDRVGLT